MLTAGGYMGCPMSGAINTHYSDYTVLACTPDKAAAPRSPSATLGMHVLVAESVVSVCTVMPPILTFPPCTSEIHIFYARHT